MVAWIARAVSWTTPTYLLYRLVKTVWRGQASYTLSVIFDQCFLAFAFVVVAMRFVSERFDLGNDTLFWCLLPIQVSRCAEIPSAFLADAVHKLRTGQGDVAAQRIELTVIVYFELLLNYAIIYRLLPGSQWTTCLPLAVDGHLPTLTALYFSVTTITTLGYGDVTAAGHLSMCCSMCEVLSAVIIAGMTVALYAGSSSRRASAPAATRAT